MIANNGRKGKNVVWIGLEDGGWRRYRFKRIMKALNRCIVSLLGAMSNNELPKNAL